MKYVCSVCGWEYDESIGYPEGGIAPGTPWSEVPEDFECPLCGVGKDSLPTLHRGHSKSSGTSLHGVPGAMPPSG